MDKPSKDGRSYDCWSSAVGGADPHYSSGPLNHWFYLASEGTGSKVIGERRTAAPPATAPPSPVSAATWPPRSGTAP